MKLSELPAVEIPNKLRKCPILEAIFELRFSSPLDDDAVFGAISNAVQPDWVLKDRLPITEMPSFVRRGDPNLRFSPHYRLAKGELLLQIGPAAISIVAKQPYPGWTAIISAFDDVLEKIHQKDIFKDFLRVGVRYVDLFERNVFSGLKFKSLLVDIPLDFETTHVGTMLEGDDGFRLVLNLAGKVMVAEGKENKQGSIFDVDVSKEGLETIPFTGIKEIFRKAHDQQKRLFFSVITPELLAEMEPE